MKESFFAGAKQPHGKRKCSTGDALRSLVEPFSKHGPLWRSLRASANLLGGYAAVPDTHTSERGKGSAAVARLYRVVTAGALRLPLGSILRMNLPAFRRASPILLVIFIYSFYFYFIFLRQTGENGTIYCVD